MDPGDWRGVFPAATTQFGPDLAFDLQATLQVQAALLDEGVHGLVTAGDQPRANVSRRKAVRLSWERRAAFSLKARPSSGW